jgi:hypothetical protein
VMMVMVQRRCNDGAVENLWKSIETPRIDALN